MKAFVGPAGSGKTHRLMEEVDAWLNATELSDGCCVLALTRMHGARRRLVERLKTSTARQRFRCMTIDRFAWTIASRWRARAHARGLPRPAGLDYGATAKIAARLLSDGTIAAWVRARYPLIIVDEFQDCRDGQLGMVQALMSSGELFLAADEFQDLTGAHSPAMRWLDNFDLEPLRGCARTDRAGLLYAAEALRHGREVTSGKGFRVLTARNAKVAAKFLANQIRWSKGQEVVVISPAGPSSSRFVRLVLERVGEKAFQDKGKEFGPYSISWNGPSRNRVEALWSLLHLSEKDERLVDLEYLAPDDSEEGRIFGEWVERQRRCGRTVLAVSDVRAACERCVQQVQSWMRAPHGVWGMTVHGAKNREFENVVVLWPFEAPTANADRLLYNAITRAKRHAVVIVQENTKGKSRLAHPPFAESLKIEEVPLESPTQLELPGFGLQGLHMVRGKRRDNEL